MKVRKRAFFFVHKVVYIVEADWGLSKYYRQSEPLSNGWFDLKLSYGKGIDARATQQDS